jgi:hypothetical protein
MALCHFLTRTCRFLFDPWRHLRLMRWISSASRCVTSCVQLLSLSHATGCHCRHHPDGPKQAQFDIFFLLQIKSVPAPLQAASQADEKLHRISLIEQQELGKPLKGRASSWFFGSHPSGASDTIRALEAEVAALECLRRWVR